MVNPLILAAAQAAGPATAGQEAQWAARVKRLAVDLTFIEQDLTPTLERIRAAGSPISGVITDVQFNENSKRLKVILRTGTTQGRPDMEPGHEPVQTMRGDTPEGADQIDVVRTLVGHQVQVWKRNVQLSTGPAGRHFRELVRIQDLGSPEDRQSADATEADGIGTVINENEAKRRVLEAVRGDKAAAAAAWDHYVTPAGEITAEVVENAIASIQGATA